MANAWRRGISLVSPLVFVTLAVSLSFSIALVIVDVSVNITLSRSMLLDSGAASGLVSNRSWVVVVNPIAEIRGHLPLLVPSLLWLLMIRMVPS